MGDYARRFMSGWQAEEKSSLSAPERYLFHPIQPYSTRKLKVFMDILCNQCNNISNRKITNALWRIYSNSMRIIL